MYKIVVKQISRYTFAGMFNTCKQAWPVVLLYAALFCTACNNAVKKNKTEAPKLKTALAAVDSAGKLIQTGDIILRTGNDFTSESLRQLNQKNKTYSHCGIASIENGQLFIYHALGGEFNPDQKIRRDSLSLFADPLTNRGFAVYRYQLPAATHANLAAAAMQLYRAGIMFDMKFDLKTDERMYCAEYVYKTLLLGTNGKVKCARSHIGDFEFIGVDDLFLHPLCSKVYATVYKYE